MAHWTRAGWRAGVIAGIVILVIVGLVGCGGFGVDVKPVTVNATARVDEPVRIEGEVPVTIQGPIVVRLDLQGATVEYSGTYVSEALMDRIQVNETTAEWISAVIGPPDSRSALSDGTEIWKWVYQPKGSQVSLLSLLGQDKDRPSPQPITAYVRLRDGVVIDKWRG